MKPRKQLLTTFSVLLIAALLVACVSPAVAPPATPIPSTAIPIPPTPTPVPPTPEPTPGVAAPDSAAAPEPLPPQEGLRPDAPEFAKHGPFWVGYKSLVIGEGDDRPLEAGLWYPTRNSSGAKDEIAYPITPKFPLEQIDAPLVAYGHALQDAEVDPSEGPYPLVVFSHGFGANAVWYNTLLEHYASHGFIVLAPEHTEQFDPEYSDIWKASIDRPLDIKRVLDYAEQTTAPGGDMAGMIDMQHVAVVGHSYGGYTALAMAGGQYDLAAFNARCAQFASDDPLSFLCAPLVPKETDMAARAGLDPMPEGLWPSLGDPRVTAIIPMAGDSYLFDKMGLAKITIPMMAIGGTADTGTPYEWGSKPAYDNASSAKRALVTLEGAEHTIISSCKNMPWISETPLGPWICFDPVWDKDRGLDLIHHFSTAFLLDTLKSDATAAAALAPQNVAFPGIKYKTTAYGAVPAAKLDDATVAKIEAQVKEIMAKGKVPGAAVGIVKDGELVYASGFGVSKLGSDKPMTPDSVFPMGSIAKTPVAVAIMQLVAEGKIDLDAPVTKYLPYFTLADPDAGAITIRQLLSHTSGLPEPTDWLAEYQDKDKRIDEGALDDYVRSLSKESLLFRPGKGWSYSGIGFDILGNVVAKVSGQSFEDYVQDHVLTPLGMENSSYLLSDVDQALLAAPHMYAENGNAKTLDFYPYSRTHAPGSFYSSVNDMARFAVANMNHGELNGTRILPASAYDKMWAPQAASPWAEMFGPEVSNYALGWWVGEFSGHRIIGNYGTDYGFQSHLAIFPDDGLAVIALVNLFDPEAGSFYALSIGDAVEAVLLDVEAKPTPQP